MFSFFCFIVEQRYLIGVKIPNPLLMIKEFTVHHEHSVPCWHSPSLATQKAKKGGRSAKFHNRSRRHDNFVAATPLSVLLQAKRPPFRSAPFRAFLLPVVLGEIFNASLGSPFFNAFFACEAGRTPARDCVWWGIF